MKAEDATLDAFLRQVNRGTLFKSLQINENLPLSRLVPLGKISRHKSVGGILFKYNMFAIFCDSRVM